MDDITKTTLTFALEIEIIWPKTDEYGTVLVAGLDTDCRIRKIFPVDAKHPYEHFWEFNGVFYVTQENVSRAVTRYFEERWGLYPNR